MSRGTDRSALIFQVASAQGGLFTARQAVHAGYSPRLQHHHWKRGHWRRLSRGIYRLRDYPPSPHEDLVYWSLWSGGKAVVSHETAAAVHGLGDVLPSRVHLTASWKLRKPIPDTLVLHRADLAPSDVEVREGFRVTTPLRTVLDLLASGIEADWLSGVVRDALQEGCFTRAALAERLTSLPGSQRDRMERILSRLEPPDHAV